MSDKISTRDHNIEILNSNGFRKVKNTTVFQKGNQFILSPAVSEGTNGKYWFDIREVNLNRIKDDSLLVVRIVPDFFIVEHIKAILTLLTEELMDNRPNSGNVWGFYIEIHKKLNKAFLLNTKKPDHKITTKLLNREELVDFFKSRNIQLEQYFVPSSILL
jgi:hypothetical protein